jgi:hypothetical protein
VVVEVDGRTNGKGIYPSFPEAGVLYALVVVYVGAPHRRSKVFEEGDFLMEFRSRIPWP